jgi:hypothetical protein
MALFIAWLVRHHFLYHWYSRSFGFIKEYQPLATIYVTLLSSGGTQTNKFSITPLTNSTKIFSMIKSSLLRGMIAFAFASALFQKAMAQNTSPYWSLAGNSNATTSSKLGTTNSIPLRLTTNNSTRLYISTGGNVGIGTTGPVQKLDVNGNINLAKGYGLYMENRRVLRVDSTLKSVFLGNSTGVMNTGVSNSATGYYALTANTSGSYNSVNGNQAMYYNTTGSQNSGFGYAALWRNETGSQNTAVGVLALSGNYGAWGNTAIGYQAGFYIPHGYYNTFIGSNANASIDGLYNTVALGSSATVTAPNQVRIGNNYTTSIGGYTTWTNISDGRVKRNIRENVPGLNFINKLKPVTYNLDLDAADKIMAIAEEKGVDGKTTTRQLSKTDIAARQAKQQEVYTGFIAQDVEKAARELKYNFSGVDAAKHEKDLYGLRYSDFVVPLVKAVQELSKENEELKNRLDKLETIVVSKQSVSTSLQSTNNSASNAASLQQNVPNPATGSTRISYTLPKASKQAQLLLTDGAGKTLRTITLTQSGIVDVSTTGLSSGVCNYSLVVDGKIIDTKRLTVAR